MPPKTQNAAKDLLVSTLPEGGYLTVSPQLIDHQLNRQYDAEILASVLGYAMYDFVNWRQPNFGAWNARELDQAHVTKIEKGYRYIGIDNISVPTAIFLVVDPSFINTSALVQEQDLNNEVPLIKWLIEPIPVTDAASGHHRYNALMQYRKALKDEMATIDSTIQTLLASKRAESPDIAKKIEMLQLRKPIVQSELDNVGQWLVRVHDLSKLSHGALTRLSENTDKPVMASTDEEALVSSLYSLIAIKEHTNFDPATFTKTISQEGRKHATTQTKMAMLFYNIPLIEILVDILRWGKHFRPAFIYRVKYLASNIVGTSCGILVTILKMLNDNLCRLLIPIDQEFQLQPNGADLLMDVKSMGKFLEMGQDAALREKANMSVDEWQQHYDRLKEMVNIDPSGHPINYSFLHPFLTAFDEAAEEELGKPFEGRGFLMHAPDMNLRVALYLEAVLTKIAPLLRSATFPGASQMASKISLMCYARGDTHAAYPLLSLFIIPILAEALTAYPNALMEISRWFDPLVDYILGKTSGMSSNDFTTEAIAAILLNKNWLVGADIKFALCVLGYRMPVLEGLEAELTRYPVRIVNKNTYSDALATQAMGRSESARNAILRKASLPFNNKVTTIVGAMQKASQLVFKFKRATPNDSFKGTTIENMECALPLRNSFIPWLQIAGKSQSREYPVIAVASMYEWYTTKEYRHNLLLSQGGLMRGHFLEVMGDFMNRLRLVHIDGTSFLPWWDGIFVVPAVIKPEKDNMKVVAAGKLTTILSKDLQSIFQKVSTSPAAQLVSGRIVLAKGKRAPMDAVVHTKLVELMKALEVNIARSVRRTEMGDKTPFFLDQDTPVHRSWVPTVAPVSDMDTFAEYPKDGNVSALVAARVTAHIQTTLNDVTTVKPSNKKGKSKAQVKSKLAMSSDTDDVTTVKPSNKKGKSKARVKSKSTVSSDTDVETDEAGIADSIHASKALVKMGSSSGFKTNVESLRTPAAAASSIIAPVHDSATTSLPFIDVQKGATDDNGEIDDDGAADDNDEPVNNDITMGSDDEELDPDAFKDEDYQMTIPLLSFMADGDSIETTYQKLRAGSKDTKYTNISRSRFRTIFLTCDDDESSSNSSFDIPQSPLTPTTEEDGSVDGLSEVKDILRPKPAKALTTRQQQELDVWNKKSSGKKPPKAMEKIIEKEQKFARWTEYLNSNRSPTKPTKRRRATSSPKTSRKKSTIQRRGGMDSDDDMEPVDEAFLISHQGHPV